MTRAVFGPAIMLTAVACGFDAPEFRPAKGVKDLPAEKTAYRIKDWSGCDSIGFIVQAKAIEDIAETAANNGGTHYRVLDDFSHETVETDFAATHTKTFGVGVTQGHATSRVEKHHRYTAEVYRCK